MKNYLLLLLAIFLFLFADAQSNIDSAFNAAQKIKDPLSRVNTLYKLCQENFSNSPNEIKPIALYTLKTAKSKNFKTEYAKCLSVVGNIYRMQSEYDSALVFYVEALELGELLQNDTLISAAHNNIGAVYKFQAFYGVRDDFGFYKALENFRLSLEVRIRLKDSSLIASSYMNIAGVYYDLAWFHTQRNLYDTALHYENLGLEIRKAIGDTLGIAKSLMNLANLYNDLGYLTGNEYFFDRALYCHLQALEIKRKYNDIPQVVQSLCNIGRFYWSRERHDSAIFYSLASLELSEPRLFHDLRLQAYDVLHQAYAAIGDSAAAYKYANNLIVLKDSVLGYDENLQLSNRRLQKAEAAFLMKEARLKTRNAFLMSSVIVLVSYVILIFLLRGLSRKRQLLIESGVENPENLQLKDRANILAHFTVYLLLQMSKLFFDFDLKPVYEGAIIILPLISIYVTRYITLMRLRREEALKPKD